MDVKYVNDGVFIHHGIVFMSTPKPVSNVRPSICPLTKYFFDFNEIWHAGRGR